jgi:outer membrane usher protein
MSFQRCALHRILLLISTLSVFLFPLKAFPQEAAVLKVVLNAEDMGEYFLYLLPDGDVWMRREDLDGTRLKKGLGRDVLYAGENYVSLASIDGLEFGVNEEEVSLEIQADPKLFEAQSIDIAYTKSYEVTYTRDNSAFLNYGVLYDFESSTLDLSNEVGVRVGGFLGISTFNYVRSKEEDRFVRLLTSVRADNRETLGTMIFGDFSAASGPLGSVQTLGGISVSRNYSVDPYFIRFPSLSLSGTLNTPSELEIYVNDRLVRRGRLYPGDFRIEDVPARVGLGTAEVVIRDAYGRETVVSKPFFYSDRLLKSGLQEYSYGIGFLRKDLGQKSFSYGEPVFIAFHNYGFTEGFKGGYALEASDGLISGGPTLSVLVSNRLGVLDAALSVSRSEGRTGFGGSLGYVFRSTHLTAGFSMRALTREFSNLGISPSDDKPAFQFSGAAGVNIRPVGSISAEYSTSRMHLGPDVSRYALSYNRTFTRNVTLFASLSRTEEESEKEDEVFLGLHVYLGRGVSGSLSYRNREGAGTERATLQKSLPVGTGFGFRADVESSEDRTDIDGEVRYQNKYGTYGLGYRDIGQEESLTLSAAGGIGYIDGSVFPSRVISDSFAKVKVGGLEDVRVYYFGNEAGTTNHKGEVIVPVLRSFRDNRIDIEARDIPIDYSIASLTEYVSPPYRGGSVIDFNVTKIQGFLGNIYIIEDGRKYPAEFGRLSVQLKDRTVVGVTGRGGEFYLENIPPGLYPAKVVLEEVECAFSMPIPESEEMWVEVGDVLCEIKQ